MSIPKVSIICICYNHKNYVEEAINSAFCQDYEHIEVIAIDDASTDGSAETLSSLVHHFPNLQLILNTSNVGNCVSFNRAFAQAGGDYVIDLAADDILASNRVSKGVAVLESLPDDFGVHFCDHEWIDRKGRTLGYQYRRDDEGSLRKQPPSGDVYAEILQRYFISAPTMMIRRVVLEELAGYDESLTYEDFDFWIRSSRNWKYQFSDDVLVKKRLLDGSLSSAQFRFGSRHDRSTFLVCQKALKLNRNMEEHKVLRKRLSYERKHAFASGNLKLAKDYHGLIGEIDKALKKL